MPCGSPMTDEDISRWENDGGSTGEKYQSTISCHGDKRMEVLDHHYLSYLRGEREAGHTSLLLV